MSFDSESARLIDRIQASAFYQAKLAGANFVKGRVKRLMHLEKGPGRHSKETLRQKLDIVLSELEFDQNLFQDLLSSMRDEAKTLAADRSRWRTLAARYAT